jgi:hypothetical protein
MVAVKLVRSELADDREFRERFRREVQSARAVGGFWTAAVVDADTDADRPWLATEYVPGPTLNKAISEHGPLPEQTVRTLASGLAEALGAIHRADLVHRDLKPANVLLGADGPRVIDFGISRAVASSSLTSRGAFVGTPGFFSPEQTAGEEVGPPSDVFSLGAVLVFAATGQGPFGIESAPIMLYRVVHSEPDLSGVPETLRPLLSACLNKNASQRPTTSDILDQIGEPSQQGSNWLPPAIKAAISEHTAGLGGLSATVPDPAPGSEGVPPGQPIPPPSPGEQTDKIAPVTSPPIPPASGQLPEPVFRTSGRLPALIFAAVLLAGIAAGFTIPYHVGFPLRYWSVLQLCVLAMEFGALLALLRVAIPPLRMRIGGEGIRVSRLGFSWDVRWSQVARVGVVTRGRSQAVAVWVVDNFTHPAPGWWHYTRAYYGGILIFPLTGRRRLHDTSRARLALEQYAARRYDARIL